MEDIVKQIEQANDAYYNSSEPIMSDKEYDELVNKLKVLSPNHPLLKSVGAPIKSGTKVKLPFWLGSMDKIKTDKEVKKFLNDNQSDSYVVTDKLDGISALYMNKKLYTRGNGNLGQDISHLIKHLHLPNTAVAVRGELIMKKGVTSKIRNVVSGIVNSKKKEIDKTLLQNLEFVAYEEIRETAYQPSPEEQLNNLSKAGYNTVVFNKVENVTAKVLEEYLIQRKSIGAYEIDGIILTKNEPYIRNTSGNPSYSVAFKLNLSANLTKVISVDWFVSKDNYIIPRITYEPIDLDGVLLQHVSGHNAKFIVSNNIGPGTVLEIVRSGDVIPYVNNIVKSTEAMLPSDIPYEWDSTHVNIITTNTDFSKVKELTYFLKKIGVKFVDEKLVSRLNEAGHNTVKKLISLTEKDLILIPTIKEKMAKKIVEQLQSALNSVDLVTLMVASNQFGRGLAEKKLSLIVNKWNNLIEDYENGKVTLEAIQEIEGFSGILAKAVILGLKSFIKWIKENKINYNKKEPTVIVNSTNSFFTGKKVVFSGFRDAVLKEKIEKNGGTVSESVSSKTDLVVVIDKSFSSSKVQKAIELGINIVTVDEALSL